MASGEQGKEVARREATNLLPHDVKEIEAVSQYANRQEKKMIKLTEEVDEKNRLDLVWDSKVPELNKRFYNFVSFKESDRDGIKAEIKKYLEFYRQICEVISKMRSDKETDEEKDIYSIILDLYENLSKLNEAAETGKKTTNSSTVCKMHNRFISKHQKLESMIKRVECVSLKLSWKKATEGLQQSLKAIDSLRSDLQNSDAKYDSLCDKFDQLLVQNKRLINQQNFLLEENAKIMMQQQKLMEDNEKKEEERKLLIDIIQTLKTMKGKNGEIEHDESD